MTERTRPEPRPTADGKTLLLITRDDCLAFGRPPATFTLDLTEMEHLLPSVLDGAASSYVSLQGPPGGPLSVQVLASPADGDAALVELVRRHVYAGSAEALQIGPAVDVIVGGHARHAVPFATSDGPSWRLAPGGCALRFGPVVLLLEAEGFELSCEAVLSHPDLGPIARGFQLDERA